METRSIDLNCAMMRQLTTLFAKMGNLGGGGGCCPATATTGATTIKMKRRRRRMTTVVRSWEEKEEEGECKNQIRCCRHHWDEGGPHKDHEPRMLHRIDGHWGGGKALGKGGAQKSLSTVGGGASMTITIAIGNSIRDRIH